MTQEKWHTFFDYEHEVIDLKLRKEPTYLRLLYTVYVKVLFTLSLHPLLAPRTRTEMATRQ